MREVQSLQAQSYEYLLGKIKEGKLVPDQVYSLNQMAAEAGLSRTPFRDAVIMLEQERYLDILPSKGFVLHKMTQEDLTETYQFREALEMYCLKQLAANLHTERGQQFFRKLREKIAGQREILASADPSAEEFGRKDYEFHRSMIQYVDNSSMLEIYRRFMYRIFWMNVTSFRKEHRMEETLKEHEGILKMVEDNDMAGLEALVANHLQLARSINVDLMENVGQNEE